MFALLASFEKKSFFELGCSSEHIEERVGFVSVFTAVASSSPHPPSRKSWRWVNGVIYIYIYVCCYYAITCVF